MARWKPDPNSVSSGEWVGRRIFSGAGKAAELSYNLFYDSRLDEDLSLDRLGEGADPIKFVVEQVTAIADAEAEKHGKDFHGWMAARCKTLKNVNIFPDPLTIAAHGVDNPYHALLDRSRAREKADAHHFSRSLFYYFREDGKNVQPVRKAAAGDVGAAIASPS